MALLYLAFVSLAGYDAVVAIEGGHEPYVPQRRTHRASSEAAAATAAYEVLRNHFPASSDALSRGPHGSPGAGVGDSVAHPIGPESVCQWPMLGEQLNRPDRAQR